MTRHPERIFDMLIVYTHEVHPLGPIQETFREPWTLKGLGFGHAGAGQGCFDVTLLDKVGDVRDESHHAQRRKEIRQVLGNWSSKPWLVGKADYRCAS